MYVGLGQVNFLPYNITCNCNSKVNDFPSAVDSCATAEEIVRFY